MLRRWDREKQWGSSRFGSPWLTCPKSCTGVMHEFTSNTCTTSCPRTVYSPTGFATTPHWGLTQFPNYIPAGSTPLGDYHVPLPSLCRSLVALLFMHQWGLLLKRADSSSALVTLGVFKFYDFTVDSFLNSLTALVTHGMKFHSTDNF